MPLMPLHQLTSGYYARHSNKGPLGSVDLREFCDRMTVAVHT